jgi:predicted lipoprotein with Yx(FWY)xxD motif
MIRQSARLSAILVAVMILGVALMACQQAATVVPTEVPIPTTEVSTAVPAAVISPTTAAAVTGTVATTLTLTVAKSDTLGEYLADGQGKTVYLYTPDSPNKSTCTGNCATAWPPLTVQGKPTGGTGVEASQLATITRDDGTTQVTYYGWPLYYFGGDAAAGDVNGQGVANVWYLVSPAGEKITGAVK